MAATLRARGWAHKFAPIARAYEELAAARFTIIEQDLTTDDYGTAVPARLVAGFVGGRSCFYLSGDDLLTAPDGGGNAVDLADLRTAATDCLAAMQVTAVRAELAHRYGVVELRDHGTSRRLVEKSSTARGRYANISRYYLSPSAFRVASEQPVDPDTREATTTEALLELPARGGIGVSVAGGSYFDCGSLDGRHRANVAMMAARGRRLPLLPTYSGPRGLPQGPGYGAESCAGGCGSNRREHDAASRSNYRGTNQAFSGQRVQTPRIACRQG